MLPWVFQTIPWVETKQNMELGASAAPSETKVEDVVDICLIRGVGLIFDPAGIFYYDKQK